jgi:predicted DNA-binding transcriptional regulator AlpA
MKRLSTREAAKKLGIDHATLSNYLAVGKLPAPETITVGRRIVHMWTEEQIEHVRQLLPKIANGRKTRYSKLKKKKNAQPRAPQPQHAKTVRAGDPKAVPHKSGKPKKK